MFDPLTLLSPYILTHFLTYVSSIRFLLPFCQFNVYLFIYSRVIYAAVSAVTTIQRGTEERPVNTESARTRRKMSWRGARYCRGFRLETARNTTRVWVGTDSPRTEIWIWDVKIKERVLGNRPWRCPFFMGGNNCLSSHRGARVRCQATSPGIYGAERGDGMVSL